MIVLLGLTTVLPLALEPAVTLTVPFITKDGSVLAGERGNTGADAVVAEGGIAADCYSPLCIGIAQTHVAENEYVIIVGKAEIKCHG